MLMPTFVFCCQDLLVKVKEGVTRTIGVSEVATKGDMVVEEVSPTKVTWHRTRDLQTKGKQTWAIWVGFI